MNASDIATRVSRAPRRTRLPTAAEAKDAIRGAAGELSPIMSAVLLALPVLAAAIFYVWTQVAAVRMGYALSEAAAEHERLVERNRGLRIEVATLKDTARLQTLAETKYKLARPTPAQIFRIGGAP